MRTQIWIALVVATIAALGGAVPAAKSQDALPRCPGQDEVLLTFPPPAIVVGHSYSVRVDRGEGDWSPITELAVFAQAPGAQLVRRDLALGEFDDSVAAVLPAPERLGTLALRFSWKQNVGTPAGCVGIDDYRVPIVRKGTRVGDDSAYRLSGAFRVRFGSGERRVWRFSPRCDLYACATSLRSTSGLRLRLRLVGDGSYRAFKQYPRKEDRYGECIVSETATGRVIKVHRRAFFTTMRWDVFVRETRGSRARTIKGTVTSRATPTPAARADGCTGRTERERFTGRLLP